MAQFGWDASDFDWGRGPMDLAAAAADGIVFFTHKASEGVSVRHQHLGEALRRARAAGIELLGAYHVVRTSPAADRQVAYFLATLDAAVPWWRTFPGFFLQVDLEKWSYDAVSAATGLAFTHALVRAQPKRVILYASRGMYGDQLADAGVPLWNAAYGNNPTVGYRAAYPGDGSSRWFPYSGQSPVFLQYGSQTRIGVQQTCDANAFRGTLEQLRTLITGGQPAQGDDDMNDDQDRLLRAIFNNSKTVKLDIGGGVLRDFPNPLAAKLAAVEALANTAAVKPMVDPLAVVAALEANPAFIDKLAARTAEKVAASGGMDPVAVAAALTAALTAHPELLAKVADAVKGTVRRELDDTHLTGPAG